MGQAIEIALNKKNIDLFNIENEALLKLLEENFPKEKESKVITELKNGENCFYLRDFMQIKKDKVFEEANEVIPEGKIIEIVAKSIGSGYEFSFEKTEKGYFVIESTHNEDLEGVTFKSLKKLIKGMPKPTRGVRYNLSWMDR